MTTSLPEQDLEKTNAVGRRPARLPKWLARETVLLAILLALAVVTWLPRLQGPIDLRWDGGVYYILGTSLAQGKGYKLLNEPGEIDAIQYPPLLPAIIAGYQLALGSDDPTTIGWWLRISAFVIFIIYIYVVFRFLRQWLSPVWSFAGAAICLFSLHVYFLSDLCFPEILFSLLTLLFVMAAKENQSPKLTAAAYLLAVLSYVLRTVGLAAFVAWVLDGIVRKQFKKTILRVVLVLIPIFCWQFYIASVEKSDAYQRPAYLYQRAPYMFYNVTYARNISLEDPFAPEKGAARNVTRFLSNAVQVPANIGETVSTLRGYWVMGLQALTLGVIKSQTILDSVVYALLYLLGLIVLLGVLLQFRQPNWIVALYLIPYLGAMAFTPFPGQYSRYLMPVTPLLVLSLIFGLNFIGEAIERFGGKRRKFGVYFPAALFSVIFLFQLYCFQKVYREDLEPVTYTDRNGRPVKYRLFYYNQQQSDFDFCITFIKERAAPNEIPASGMPHWLHLRTGLKAIMPPFEADASRAQELLDSVPVKYLVIGQDVIKSERYTLPVIERYRENWRKTYTAPAGVYSVYERIDPLLDVPAN